MKKTSIIILLVTMLIIMLSGNVFASVDYAFQGSVLTLPDLPNNSYSDYLIITWNSNKMVNLYQFNYDKNNPPYFSYNDNNVISAFFLVNQEHKMYLLSNEKWDLRFTGSVSTGVGGGGTNTEDYYNVVYSTCNIYKKGTQEVVFQPTPQLVGEVTIPEITQVEEIPQMMGKVLEMIIPIGLIIFGIGLLILLVRLVISRMT